MEYLATSLALASTHFKSLDFPSPRPFVLVGVFTDIKIISADSIASFIFVEKNFFLFLVFAINSCRPGSKKGYLERFLLFHYAIHVSFISTTLKIKS